MNGVLQEALLTRALIELLRRGVLLSAVVCIRVTECHNRLCVYASSYVSRARTMRDSPPSHNQLRDTFLRKDIQKY